MKSIILITSLTLIVISSCKKDDIFQGKVTGYMDGRVWSANASAEVSAKNNKTCELNFDWFNKEFPEGAIGIQNIPIAIGKYRVFKINWANPDSLNVIGFYSTFLEDALCDMYHVVDLDSLSNFIQVESYDPKSKKLIGKFALKVAVDYPKCRASASDTVMFNEGYFETIIR